MTCLPDGIYKSACRMCHGGCGTLVHVREGRVVKVAGDPDSPLNRGRICPKGAASVEHLYNPNRLKYPLKRAGERGGGRWERISWDEALDTIAGKVAAIKAKYGPEAVAVGSGTGRYHVLHIVRFAQSIGTPNWCEPGSAQCIVPRIEACGMTYGAMPVCDYYGDVNPACVLVWGQNPVVSGPDGEIQFRAKDCIRKGTQLIVVDPRRTWLAQRAALWLPVRPGTDDALALGMLNVIIGEELYDREFVARWTVGFDRLAERVREYPPDRVAAITEVPAEKIRAAARLFAQTKPATLEWGCAIEQTPNCFQTVRAISLLPGICGDVDVPGGWIIGMDIMTPPPPLVEEEMPAEVRRKRLGADRFKVLAGGPDSPFPAAHIPTLFKAMREGIPYPVKAFLIFGNNALVSYANSKRVYDTLKSLEFLSVMDLYMTPTTELADIVLPSATWLEVDEIIGVPFVAHSYLLPHQKIVQIGECRQTEEVLIDLVKRLGLTVKTDSLEETYSRQMAKAGITFTQLKEQGFATVPQVYRKYEEEGFHTPSGKVELYSSIMEKLGYDPLPYYEEPPESPVSTPQVAAEFPLVLTTGGRSQFYFCTEYRQIPSLRRRDPDPQAEIHSRTAEELGIADGDWVWIETLRGRIKQKAKVTDNIKPNVVNVQYGWWFPEDASPDHGVWKSNANVLTNDAPPYCPSMGTYQLRALLCKVYKAKKES